MWDFDGTLAIRPGMWSGVLREALDLQEPGHRFTRGEIAAHLQDGFPWHTPDRPHPELADPDQWWRHLAGVMTTALIRAGLPEPSAASAADAVRGLYVDPSSWTVYPQANQALQMLAEAGWRNIIVSNHVPELPDLVAGLGLAAHVHATVSSARYGFEKPHPQAFRTGLIAAGLDPDPAPWAAQRDGSRYRQDAWMIGDNPVADIAGAAQIAVPGIWVRPTDMTDTNLAALDHRYRGSVWHDWRQHCTLTTMSLLDAVRIVERAADSTSIDR